MTASPDNAGCSLCPRRCLSSRAAGDPGWCGVSGPPGSFRVARLMSHHWEEPWISGSRGSGAVFFSGCNLGCCFCQNSAISLRGQGVSLERGQLVSELMKLIRMGVHNLNLVTASQYADQIPDLIGSLRQQPEWQANPLPVIWNSSGYETIASLEGLAETVDIFLPDLKYCDAGLSADLAGAADYFAVASQAILAMHRLRPECCVDEAGLLQRGTVVRHLVLPGQWRDSCRILDFLAASLPLDTPLSLMCQYTPQPGLPLPDNHPELRRRLTTLEYRKVLDHALDLGFSRISGQRRAAADAAYTPDFSSLWAAED